MFGTTDHCPHPEKTEGKCQSQGVVANLADIQQVRDRQSQNQGYNPKLITVKLVLEPESDEGNRKEPNENKQRTHSSGTASKDL